VRRIEANVPVGTPPAWAILERSLFDLLAEAPTIFETRFCRPDGSLVWRSTLRDRDGRIGMSSRGSPDRDGGDDFYEPFRAWPLVYALGGDASLLERGHRHWEGVTRQLTALGLVDQEYCIGFDWYHQSEGNALFQFLALADPMNEATKARAERFAGYLLNEGVPEPNYDPVHRIIRAPHVGSGGPRWGIRGEPAAWWIPGDAWILERLPFEDVPGVRRFEDLLDADLGMRMAVAMEDRMGRGDAVVNLAATSLPTTAFLLTGEERFRAWVVEYVDGWIERSRPFDGLVPDNVGLDGNVGTYVGGRWYGANYGWTWPFGYFSVAMAVTVAAQNAHLLTGERKYLDFAGQLIDTMWERGRVGSVRPPMTLGFSLANEFAALRGREEMWLIPYRHADSGWFDWQPMTLAYPTALWAASGSDADLLRARKVSTASDLDRSFALSTFTRDDNGHERPWLEFLAGRNPEYPNDMLLIAHDQVRRRVDRILADEVDLEMVDVDDWQLFNPVTVEALCHLVLGAPPPIYNGGLLFAPVFYFDADNQRPGLPAGVAALVRSVEHQRVVLELVNLAAERRSVLIQAGVYGEHRFTVGSYQRRVSSYPGGRAYQGTRWYGSEPLQLSDETVDIDGAHLEVDMAPHSRIELDLGLRRNVGEPRLQPPPHAE
jgi:hypothetical protein